MRTHTRQIILARRPDGIPCADDFALREVPLPVPAEGELLIENLYLSLDAAIRSWMKEDCTYFPPIPLGAPVRSTALGRVLASRHPDFRPGDVGVAYACSAWAGHATVPAAQFHRVDAGADHPLHYHLSLFSAMGLTPYFGMLDIGRPRPGETALISAAAGAVGSLAGQIARIKGCRVVGIAGSDEKCRMLVDEFGFDAAFNYKGKDCAQLSQDIARLCPDGVDIFFDNVGGEILDAALLNLAMFARIAFCGAIGDYNRQGPIPGPYHYWQILARCATVRGFLTLHYQDRFPAAIAEMRGWLADGRLKLSEDIVQGLDSVVPAFARLFRGENTGKLLVKLETGAG
ncbi:NADP-dependent oxidoreductase [Thauera linaloolentis]|uniref:Oxidoreductase n=1 Tax=Thauera linaloolentis (strain DSM 12138 / JCM 21573 / CCUG 41526 / CIP 105981 / IAM 15112 / NBRC 102519 / 47Lol) TaxID=1123367 RepID=N6Y6T0_THAL4|nr:NADP-dependent oxidoreductase [Thauera linaloolentis]ENO87285.1 oxidoreductase [Thauera linaloolentis 47Lol = DSM 12138]MCM8566734.1 NADP-dependent oxidoreductase [Thauera linaloolentis]